MSATERDEKIFEIVNQLNQGSDLISSETERHDLAKLNLAAAQRAKLATAYVATVEYANKGIQLLPQRAWQQSYEFTLNLYNLGAEAACLGGEYERMELFVEVVLQQARDLLDTMKVYEARILADVARSQQPKAVQTALAALKLLGVEFPDAPTEADVDQIFQETAALLGNKTVEELLELPTMEAAEAMAALRILATVTAGVYQALPILMPFVVCKQVSLSIQYGNADASAQAYAWYGVLLCSFGEIELGDRMGQLAMDILSRSQSREFITSTVNMVYTFVKPWKQPLQELLLPLLEGYQSGLETGALEYAGYCCYNYCVLSFFLGKNLTILEPDFKTYNLALVQLKQDVTHNYHRIYYQSVLNLLGFCDIPWVLQGEIYDEGCMVPLHRKTNDNYALATLHVSKLILCYIFYEHSQAVRMATEAKQYLGGVAGFFIISVHRFYEALSHLALLPTQQHPADELLPQIFSDNLTELQQWAHHAPTSQMHRVYLLDAERYRVLGQQHKAMDFYDRAIAEAKVNQFLQEEALANELAAKFYLDWEREKLAVAYMQEAYYCYAQWGAKAKIDDLEKRYPQLLYPILHRQPLGENTNSKITTLTRGTVSNTSTSIGELLDLASLMKASRSLSQEIDLKGAIANFMEVIQENAGAETVALILLEEDILLLVAHATGEEMSVISIPVDTSNNVPLTLINQVKNTREHIVLDNAKEDNDYNRDDYIQKHQPQSVLCMPLIDRGQLIGILYLENNQVRGAFTRDRVEILNLLCSQAAIALQNAQLYDKEQLARNDLQQALTDLQQAQLQLVQSEKMATLGNLVAGVAHEINNPVGFIGGNVDAAQEHLQDLLSILSLYQENTSPSQEIAEEIEELEPDFIAEDFPKLIASMAEGCNIIRNISKSLRTFSRTDTVSKTEFNLHDGIDSTLLILKYRLKANEQRPAIEIIKKYGDIPEVKCYPGQLNQVFMNLLANAIDALDESNEGKTFQQIEKDQNQITIETELSADKKSVIVRIADNGTGMPEEVKARIFQQGYTTKGVGKGTGLGMAIADQIITEKHGGMISCDSTVGQGTIFTIVIPK